MNGKKYGLMIVTPLLMITGLGQAATFRLSSPGQTGNTITVAPGADFTVAVVMETPEAGNTFEVFLGYDVSSAAQPGLAGSPTQSKLVRISSLSDVAGSIDSSFDVWRSAKTSTAREAVNGALKGRPYGMKVVGARRANSAGGTLTLFSATFRNNMAAGDSTAIVISDAGTGSSYTSAWKRASTSSRGGYVLQVASQAIPTPAPLPGDANHDNWVNFGDFAVLQNNYGQSGRTWEQGDFNNDGRVTFEDFSILQNHFGQSLSGPATAAEAENVTGMPCLPVGIVLMTGTFLTVLGLGVSGARNR